MESQQIRARSVDARDPEGMKAFAVEILQELAAQVADLNDNLRSTSMACERIANQMEKNSTFAERKAATTREEAICKAGKVSARLIDLSGGHSRAPGGRSVAGGRGLVKS